MSVPKPLLSELLLRTAGAEGKPTYNTAESSVIRRWTSGAKREQFRVTKERVTVLYSSIASYGIGVTEFN